MVVYVSDYISTDEKKVYDDAKTALLSNRFYKKTRRLCLYIETKAIVQMQQNLWAVRTT